MGPTVPVIVDDRALNQRGIQMLGAILAQDDLAQDNGDGDGGPPAPPPPARRGRSPRLVRAAAGDGARPGSGRRGNPAAP